MVERIKAGLLSNDENVKVDTAMKINNLLKGSDEVSNEYIMSFICTGVANILCDNLITQNDEFFSLVMRCLLKIGENRNFYTSNLATRAIATILQLGITIAKNPNLKQRNLRYFARLLASILTRARSIHISYVTRDNIAQCLCLVEYLDVNNTLNPVQITNGTKLLLATMQYINDRPLEDKLLDPLKKLYHDYWNGLCKIIPKNLSEDDLPIFESITLGLGISIEGLRLNKNLAKADHNDYEASNSAMSGQDIRSTVFKDIIQFTFEKILNIIVPNFPKINESDKDITVPLQYLVECLILLFTCPIVDHKTLTKELLNYKYLNYFMMKIESPDDVGIYKGSICNCVSYMVMHQAKNDFFMDKWNNGLTNFRIFINEALAFFTNSPNIKPTSHYYDALLFCIYIRHQFCPYPNILDILLQISLTKRIATYCVDNPPQIPIVQVVWLLFSFQLLESDVSQMDASVRLAVNKMILLLKNYGVTKCYAHNPVILISVLRNSIYPFEIAYEVVKLSLEIDPPITDIYNLVGAEYQPIIIGSLMNALLDGKKIVTIRAFDELYVIIQKKNSLSQIIISSMWESVPQVLANYTQAHECNTEQYLKLLCSSAVKDLPLNLVTVYATKFLTSLQRKDIEIREEIKTYILLLMSALLYIGSDLKELISLFIDNQSFLNNIYSETYKEGKDELSTAALTCLSLILKGQIELSVESEKILLIELKELFSLLSTKLLSSDALLKFFNVVWISGITDNSAININFNVENVPEMLLGLYDGIWNIFGKSPPTEWAFIFTNLINFLNFCHQNCPQVLRSCCDHLETFMAIDLSVSRNYIHREFFEFMNVWLQCGLHSGSGYIKRAMTSKLVRERGVRREKCAVLSFERTLQNFKTYIVSLIDAKNVEEEDMKELLRVISTII